VARITSIHEAPRVKRQHWEWGFQFVRYISPKLMLCMHWLILSCEMQHMPTLKVTSSISETCLTRIKSANVWPHSHRLHARNDNTEKEVHIFSDFCGQNYFYIWATSFSEVICNKRQHWKWGFQFVRYIWTKLMLCMHWLILRREMQYMPTVKVTSSISETCDVILKGSMQKMTTMRKRFWFFQTSVARITSIHEAPRVKRQHWEWGFQFVRYISPKLMLCMHW